MEWLKELREDLKNSLTTATLQEIEQLKETIHDLEWVIDNVINDDTISDNDYGEIVQEQLYEASPHGSSAIDAEHYVYDYNKYIESKKDGE
ncbi:hypothetical protein ACFX5K_01205 [Rickettsiales bacterium LUAb2]